MFFNNFLRAVQGFINVCVVSVYLFMTIEGYRSGGKWTLCITIGVPVLFLCLSSVHKLKGIKLTYKISH